MGSMTALENIFEAEDVCPISIFQHISVMDWFDLFSIVHAVAYADTHDVVCAVGYDFLELTIGVFFMQSHSAERTESLFCLV